MGNEQIIAGPPLTDRVRELSGDTLPELLERAVERTPDAIALVIRRDLRDERWSYRELAATVERVAARLRAAGVGHGDRVLTWSQNDPWLVAVYFATWRLGAVIVPLDLRMQTDVAVRIGRRARASLLLAGADADRAVASELDVPILGVDEASLDPQRTGGAPSPGFRTVGPGDLAEIVFTSGTTSDPKGVMLTHGQVIHSARAIAQTGMGKRPERALAIATLSHMYGQTVPLLMGFMGGSTLVFLRSLSPKGLSDTMQRERVTAVTISPHVMRLLLTRLETEARRRGREKTLARMRTIARRLPRRLRRLLFRSVLAPLGGALEVIACGGAMLPPELQQAFEDLGILVIQGYGTTEMAVIAGHSRSRQRAGTVGPPFAGLEVRIDEDGELLARGPNLMLGYWEAPEATAEVLDADGWLHTGDTARIDEHGEIVILGRTRDRIALPSGFNVYPEDVEAAIVAIPAVRAVAVVEPSPGKLGAALVPADTRTSDDDLAAAIAAANATLAPHQRVRSWRRWPDDDLPRTHTAKVRRGPIQEWYAGAGGSPSGGGARPGAASAALVTEAGVAKVVAGVLAEARGISAPELTGTTRIDSLELDSLTVVSVALQLEAAFGAPLSDDEVLGVADIGQLYETVLERQGAPAAPPPSEWAFSRPARTVRRVLNATIVGLALDIVAHPRVEGLEHLEGLGGPALICPDHTSHLDAPLVRAALPAQLRDGSAIAAAADYWFGGRVVGPAVELALGAIPFGRTSDVRASLERVAELVNRGHAVIIFPEGGRSADGRLQPLREGIGLLATRLRVPVVPVHIDGTHEILPKGARFPTHRARRHVVVRFGPPETYGPDIEISEATHRLSRAIAALRQEPAGAW